jgi:amino acid transporter
MSSLARRLNLFDTTMIVMGGIVGAGIFMNPAVVAQEVSSATAALGAWALGGLFALAGAFIYAELAARRPAVGGQYDSTRISAKRFTRSSHSCMPGRCCSSRRAEVWPRWR